MKLYLLIGITGILLVGLAAIFLVVRAARNMAFTLVYPPRNPVTKTPDSVGLENWEEISFVADGLQLKGWFTPPAEDTAGATLIFVHGWTGNRTAHLRVAAILAKYGYGSLLIDSRNSGESEGNITTWGYTEADDVQAAFEYLLTRSEVNPDKIGVYGGSTGGAAVTRAAANNPQIRLAIVESTYTALTDNLSNVVNLLKGRVPTLVPLVLWFSKQETGLPLEDIRPVDDVTKIAPRPIMLIHGTDDIVVNISHSQKIFEAATGPKELYTVPGAGHGDVLSENPEEFESRLIAFLRKYL
jgi:dipeptidyl aminopeptidase/acylaminoacyl peptidase